jgi:diguanylate cyclase (GGDEF)-like protein/PAS domain S-box-containing protein
MRVAANPLSSEDTTELNVELEALRQREELLDVAEQLANIGHCEWDYDDDCIKTCSEGYARIFNLSMEEVIASQSSWDKVLLQIHPEDREKFTRSYQSQREVGSHEIEYRIIRADNVVRHVYQTGTVEFGGTGNAIAAFGLLQDITDRKVYQQALENREAMARQVESITDIGHFIFDLQAESYIYLSQGFAGIHGVSIDEYSSMVKSRDDDMEDLHPDDYAMMLDVYERHRRTGEEFNAEYRIYRTDGELRWIREHGTALRSVSGEISQSIGVIQDITQQYNTEQNLREARDTLESMVKSRTRKLADTVRQLEDEIKERKKITAELDFLANHDALTGLPSLRLCKDRLDHSLAEARRQRQMSAVMFLDLDGFKAINDQHGHEFGDLVLKATADRIKNEIRETDTVARIGGDEFVVILSSVPEIAIAKRIAGSLVQKISEPLSVESTDVRVSVSIGIALYPENGDTAEALIRSADKAMYRIKRQGKDNFGFALLD